MPDSTNNEPESHGFVHFSINQLSDNPLGSIIENTAAIYFDLNEPVITNTVFHEVATGFPHIPSSIDEADLESTLPKDIVIYPNPASNVVHVAFPQNSPDSDFDVKITDLFGREMIVGKTSGSSLLTIDVSALPAGVYLVEVLSKGERLRTEKVVVH